MYTDNIGAQSGIYPYNNMIMPRIYLESGKDEKVDNHLHATDIWDNQDSYIIRIDLAGYGKENIKATTCDNTIDIVAKAVQSQDAECKVVSSEIIVDDFYRVYELQGVDMSAITAKYMDGVLQLTLPKSNQEKSHEPREVPFE